MCEADDQEENESAHDVTIEAVDALALRLEADAEEERKERHGLELEPERHRARPRVLWAVEEFLEQRVAEDRDEVHRQDAEQGNASKHVEGFDAVSRFDGHSHRVSLPRSKRREGSQIDAQRNGVSGEARAAHLRALRYGGQLSRGH